jgi:ADP-ribose pyrophosphatase
MVATINSRTKIHQGRVYELISENITLENGVTTDMEFVHHPGAAAIVPMPDQSRVILIKQYRHSLREHIWEIPAGTRDEGETMLSCARRELVEETGYCAQKWIELSEITPVPGYSDERIRLFLATHIKTAQQNLDKDEMLKVHTINFGEALNMIRRGEIRDGKTISGLFLAETWLQNRVWKGKTA